MYLRELRINGFKSFAEATRLELDHGVTAIVGPNGCGKSNIADAIRWVLGEQSAKSLRAGAMQDVIFQGTSGRKPVNLCEVTLVFSECEAQLGTAYHEVEVSRRVVRDGGSEYRLNGKACRLKDIQRLFLDTGVGQVSYSFMLQGQIDQVLSSNPNERRAIFEEAAGISKYKAQRREALNKLGQVDANLARVTDVIEEVGRQAGSLKRQASKALRYQRIHHRLVHLDLAHTGVQYGELREGGKQLRGKLETLAGQMAKEAEQLKGDEARLAQQREAALALRNRMEEAQSEVYRLRTEKENAGNRKEMAETRREDLGRRLEAIEVELGELKAREEALAEKLAGESQAKQEQLDLFGNTDEAFQERSAALGQLQQELSAAETRLSQAKQQLLVKEGSVSRLRSHCTGLELDLKSYQVKHANLTEEMQNLGDEEGVLRQEQGVLEQTLERRRADRMRQQEHCEQLRAERGDQLGRFRELQQSLQETERERAGLQASREMLEDLQAKLEGLSEGARAILQGSVREVVPEEACTLFLKQLKVAEGWTAAVELLLGPSTDGVFLRDGKRLVALAESLREKRIGRAPLLGEFGGKALESAGGAPEGWVAAGEVVDSDDEQVGRFLSGYLGGCYLCDDLAAVMAGLADRPDFRFALVATRAGELMDARGVVLAGAVPEKGANKSFLQRRNQLKKLLRQLEELADRQERQRLEVDQLQKRLEQTDKRIEEQNGLLSEIGTELTTLETQLAAGSKSIEQKASQRKNRETELARLESGNEESNRKLEAARKELEETEKAIADGRARIGELERAVETVRGKRETMREAFDKIRFDVAEKKQRLALLDRGLEELQRQTKEAEATRAKLGEEKEQLKARREALEQEQARHGEEAAVLEKRLGELREKLEKERGELREREQRIRVLEEGLAPRREQQQKIAAEHNKAEVEEARLDSRLQYLREECEREHGRDAGELDWRVEYWKAGEPLPERLRVDVEETDPEEVEASLNKGEPSEEALAAIGTVDWEEVGAEIKLLREREQSMGPVNLVAIEEYKDLKERHSFLQQQSEDLWNAKTELLEAIDEINRTSRSMFEETFAAIRKNFHYTFETLFGGGKSDLRLVDTEDILESGIEITAQPPGTRLRSLALLSGGQKTMTAVALLFAIYMVKPSPFCVLDEIDAPLDDANIGRFTGMLEEFLEYSQFLIITHNKRTISVADTIYGATMQEKGVSRMISMRFNKATGQAEVAAAENGRA